MEARIDRKIYLVDSKVDSVGTQTSTVDSKVVSAHSVTDSKVDSVGTQSSTIDSKVDSVGTQTSTIDSKVASVGTQTSTVDSKVASVGTQVSTFDSKVVSAHTVTDSKIDSLGGVMATEIKSVAAGATTSIAASSYALLELDSGTDGAEILGVAIRGVVGSDFNLEIYVPTADAITTPAAADKRNKIVYTSSDTEGGLLTPFAIPYNGFLKFQNLTGASAVIDEVITTYRSPGTLTAAAWSVGA